MNTRIITLWCLTISSVAVADETPGYTAALAAYTEDKLLGSAELERIITSCDQGAIANPIPRDEAELDTAKWHAHETLQEWITAGGLDAAQVCEWAKKTGATQSDERRERETAREDTAMSWEEEPPSKLSVGDELVCAVQHDGALLCWNAHFEFHLHANEGPVRSVSLFESNALIIMADGALRRLGLPKRPEEGCSPKRNNDGRFVCEVRSMALEGLSAEQAGLMRSVSAGFLDWCVVKDDWTALCQRFHEHRHAPVSSSIYGVPKDLGLVRSVFVARAVYRPFACAILADKVVQCWGLPSLLFSNVGRVRSIAISFNLCAVKENYTVSCVDQLGKERPIRKDPGPVVAIASGVFMERSGARQGGTCAIRVDGDVVCWTDAGDALNGKTGPAESISVGYSKACALLKTGVVTCWNLNDFAPHDDDTLEAPKSLKMK